MHIIALIWDSIATANLQIPGAHTDELVWDRGESKVVPHVHVLQAYVGMWVQLYSFLTSALDGHLHASSLFTNSERAAGM